MKTTVLVFHPNFQNSRVNKTLAQAAEAAGAEVRYLYDLYPDGKIDAAAEQAALLATDRIVLQFPFYWYSSPSLLKEWQDTVLEHGWAYGSQGTALHGKELLVAVSPGAKAEMYQADGFMEHSVEEFLLPFKATSKMIGTRYLAPFITAGTLYITDQELEAQAKKYQEKLQKN